MMYNLGDVQMIRCADMQIWGGGFFIISKRLKQEKSLIKFLEMPIISACTVEQTYHLYSKKIPHRVLHIPSIPA